MSLPWDRFTPDEAPISSTPPPAPSPPPRPAAPVPPLPPLPPAAPQPLPTPTPPGPDLGGALSAALEQAWPAIKAQAVTYARETVAAAGRGQDVDHTHPTITATTSTGRELVVADAKSRSWRTFLQGLAVDLLAGLTILLTTLTGLDPFARDTWLIMGALAVKTIVQTVFSYLMRLRITPTIRTDDGAKMAVMPIPRPMLPSDKATRRSDYDAETVQTA
jgi:hypothetical protein